MACELELKSEFFAKNALSSLEILETFFRDQRIHHLIVKNDLELFKKFLMLRDYVLKILQVTDPRDKGED